MAWRRGGRGSSALRRVRQHFARHRAFLAHRDPPAIRRNLDVRPVAHLAPSAWRCALPIASGSAGRNRSPRLPAPPSRPVGRSPSPAAAVRSCPSPTALRSTASGSLPGVISISPRSVSSSTDCVNCSSLMSRARVTSRIGPVTSVGVEFAQVHADAAGHRLRAQFRAARAFELQRLGQILEIQRAAEAAADGHLPGDILQLHDRSRGPAGRSVPSRPSRESGRCG